MTNTLLIKLKRELRAKATKKRAKALKWFFKTGKGEYGEGDIFIGVTLPELRRVTKKYAEKVSLRDIDSLLKDKIHEYRMIALAILTYKYRKADRKTKEVIADFYLKHTKVINNWDLVDCSAGHILGDYLLDKDKSVLYKLAKSKNLWERRIAIISTSAFINKNDFEDTLKIAKILIRDDHDLIHKAVGWMLREVGKRSLKSEELFLKKHYKIMPRTMLRYAIERFPEKRRQEYLKGMI
ncbi:MAG: alkylation repair enzyme protein [Parcubacteria group bacterium GW2011_GWA1_45_7]|nr:MAG: alkylation repair enzyme protein [Parcubacteria group bacterium GW2011_GWA1_45_7]KKU10740.1 MAG: alkylation repair enzyme protein [Parcubacteria group bacterium GW2011_GWF1_45_5]